MRWPWQRRIPLEKAIDVSGIKQAEAAKRAAEKDLEKARAQAEEAARVTAQLRELRENNHFAEMFSRAMRKRRA